jgi:glucokinase
MEAPIELAERLARSDDPIAIIVSAAVDSQCALCEQTLRTFVSILGAEAGNLALGLLANGGIYLAADSCCASSPSSAKSGFSPQSTPRGDSDRYSSGFRFT